jgi:outer membrane lipoprotein-sorting protein
MPRRRACASVLFLCLTSFGLSSCLARRRVITRAGGGTSTPTLLVTDKNTLIQTVANQFQAIRDFTATVDMVPALGSAEKNRITEYKDVRAFILFRKPADIRIIGLVPVVRNTAFDMVSNGSDFKLYVPAKSRFIVGNNELSSPSPNKLENLRPQHFLDALMVRPVDLAADKVLLENLTDEDNAAYILHLIRIGTDGQMRTMRTIWFSRLNLRMARQIIYDDTGNILTDARYSDWQVYDRVPFPKHVEINRPHDEYAVVIHIVKMDINTGIRDDKFALNQPEGTTLQTVGQNPPAAPARAATAPGKGRTRKK